MLSTLRKTGRPVLDAAEKRSERLNLRFTIAEIETLRVSAETAGLSVTEYLRQKSLTGTARPTLYRKGIDPALITQMNELGLEAKELANQSARLGNVAMQIVRAINFDTPSTGHITNPELWQDLPQLIQDNQDKIENNQQAVAEILAKMVACYD